MNSFTLNNNILHAENVGLNQIAREFGTPCYVYSKAALTLAFERFSAGFIGSDHLVCFAVKSNPSLAILNLFAKLGAGFDIVSGGDGILAEPAERMFQAWDSGGGGECEDIRPFVAAIPGAARAVAAVFGEAEPGAGAERYGCGAADCDWM